MFDNTQLQQYRSLKDDVAAVSIDSSLVKMTGQDRHAFLHNFCTNEIKAMPVQSVCEAFILDGKGKTRFHVHVLNTAQTLWLHSVAGDADDIIEHLDKYLMRDDVTMAKADDFHGTFITGPNANTAIKSWLSDPPPKNHVADVSDELVIANLELAGWGFLCLSQGSSIELDPKIPIATEKPLQAVRIENETPWMGIDIDGANLPQELRRDEKCISFTKGCYLGQETVARIDAIGRVNQVIAKIQSSQSMERNDPLHHGDKAVGKVLSVSWSPDHDCFLALAMVRRPHEKPDTQLRCGDTTVTVIS